jgi:hypothetical protein
MPLGWTNVTALAPGAVDTMLQLTDGTIMCKGTDTPNWFKLTPDSKGDYVNGSWSTLSPMPANAPVTQGGPVDAPLYFASEVLKDGRVFVAGGEYNAGTQFDVGAAEIYDPVADSWTSVALPAGWVNVGDAPACTLPNGKVLIGDINSQNTWILDPTTKTFSPGGKKDDKSEEETWTLLPNNFILCAEVDNHPKAERYKISSNKWVSAGSVPAGSDLVLNSPVSIEIGPAILMQDGKVFCTGATGKTALYNYKTNSWKAGPVFPIGPSGNPLRAFDAPAALLTSGHVLCVVGDVVPSGQDKGWAGLPISCFEFDGVALNPAPAPGGANNTLTYNCRLLGVPTGQVLLSNCTSQVQVYTHSGGPHHSWRPRITHVPKVLRRGHTYKLSGHQLNGRSQANCYGDDAQMANNYPLVRLKHATTNKIVFCRTFNHSTMAVATGNKTVHTEFHVPPTTPLGHYELVAIANSIHSPGVAVVVKP